MMKSAVSASVLLPIRNAARYLGEALESLRAQTFRDFEVIAVDDGSTDETPRILAAVRDPRVRVVRLSKSCGVTAALNLAASLSKSEFLIRHDADDRSHPRRIERQLAALARRPTVVMVGSDFEIIDALGRALSKKVLPRHTRDITAALEWRNIFAHGGVAIRRRAFQRVGGYDPRMRYSQDFDLYRRLARVGRLEAVPAVLYSWRQNPSSVSGRLRDLQSAYVSYVWAGKPAKFRKFVESRRRAWRLHYKGVAHAASGHLRPAISAFVLARRSAPENMLTAYALASAYKRLPDSDRSRMLFESVANAGPRELAGLAKFHLAELAVSARRLAAARDLLRSCLETVPGHQSAKKLLRNIRNR